MLTDFEFFIATLPDWDGKDRVTELQNLVNAAITVYDKGKEVRFTNRVRVLIEECFKDNYNRVCNLMFCGKQGMGKSTFARWLFPFYKQETRSPYNEYWTGMVANECLIMESEERPSCVSSPYTEDILCELKVIDYSYTGIDIKQLYAQVLAERKK